MADTTQEPANNPAPLHPFEVRIHIGGDDWEYVLHTMQKLSFELREHGPDYGTVSGGAGGCHSVTIAKRDISAADYREELHEWWIATKK